MKPSTRGHKMREVGNMCVYNKKTAKCETAPCVRACEQNLEVLGLAGMVVLG